MDWLTRSFYRLFFICKLVFKEKSGLKRALRSIFHEDKNRYGIDLQGIIFVGFVYALMYIFLRVCSFCRHLLQDLKSDCCTEKKNGIGIEWSETVLILLAFSLLLVMEV